METRSHQAVYLSILLFRVYKGAKMGIVETIEITTKGKNLQDDSDDSLA